eukprot:8513757-Ditylum_brightwellii.AAC.1
MFSSCSANELKTFIYVRTYSNINETWKAPSKCLLKCALKLLSDHPDNVDKNKNGIYISFNLCDKVPMFIMSNLNIEYIQDESNVSVSDGINEENDDVEDDNSKHIEDSYDEGHVFQHDNNKNIDEIKSCKSEDSVVMVEDEKNNVLDSTIASNDNVNKKGERKENKMMIMKLLHQ